MTSSPVRKSGIVMAAALLAAACIGCGGDDRASGAAKTSASTEPTAAAGSSEPSEVEIREFTCGDFELGLTNTDGAYVVSAVSRTAGVDMHTASKTLEQICRRAKPRTRPYARAVRQLGGDKTS